VAPTHNADARAGGEAADGQVPSQGTGQENAREEAKTPAPYGQAATGTEGILPNKAAEDDPRRWGDGPDDDHDAWLKEQKPPHWG
jgi:hypothetical protein